MQSAAQAATSRQGGSRVPTPDRQGARREAGRLRQAIPATHLATSYRTHWRQAFSQCKPHQPTKRQHLKKTNVIKVFPSDSDSKESACNDGDLGLIPGLGRSPRGGHGNPLQYSCLENPMDRGAWRAMVHGVAKSQTRQKQLKQACTYQELAYLDQFV